MAPTIEVANEFIQVDHASEAYRQDVTAGFLAFIEDKTPLADIFNAGKEIGNSKPGTIFPPKDLISQCFPQKAISEGKFFTSAATRAFMVLKDENNQGEFGYRVLICTEYSMKEEDLKIIEESLEGSDRDYEILEQEILPLELLYQLYQERADSLVNKFYIQGDPTEKQSMFKVTLATLGSDSCKELDPGVKKIFEKLVEITMTKDEL